MPPLVHDKLVAYGKHQQNKPNIELMNELYKVIAWTATVRKTDNTKLIQTLFSVFALNTFCSCLDEEHSIISALGSLYLQVNHLKF